MHRSANTTEIILLRLPVPSTHLPRGLSRQQRVLLVLQGVGCPEDYCSQRTTQHLPEQVVEKPAGTRPHLEARDKEVGRADTQGHRRVQVAAADALQCEASSGDAHANGKREVEAPRGWCLGIPRVSHGGGAQHGEGHGQREYALADSHGWPAVAGLRPDVEHQAHARGAAAPLHAEAHERRDDTGAGLHHHVGQRQKRATPAAADPAATGAAQRCKRHSRVEMAPGDATKRVDHAQDCCARGPCHSGGFQDFHGGHIAVDMLAGMVPR
mmetsp:Transcript_99535/g.320887  ORF Transcript_99535/g.320887 Transcript_99535/m.320887 type:complete len:269 (+) Transcript_99535:17-823(+)